MTEKVRKSGNNPLLNLTLTVILVVLIGYLLQIGQAFILPVLAAFIFVIIFNELDKALTRIPYVGKLPSLMRKTIIYIGFLALLAALISLFTVTIQELIVNSNVYQENLIQLFNQLTDTFGEEYIPDWNQLSARISNSFRLQTWLLWIAGQVSAASGTIFLVIVYIAFLLGERVTFAAKFAAAFPNPEKAARVKEILEAVNTKVGQYLGAKTFINVILALVSYVIMLGFGLDYAAFWALLIGLLNYIPYIGSAFGVLFPVALSIVQFVSWPWTIALAIALLLAQIIMGNFVEPKLIGRTVNQSAFVVLLALSFWVTLWGLPGAILAVPMTSIIGIILSEFKATRPLAVFMSEDVED
ncbi:AI-2E family transporter [Gleimia sp. 6138-11-ORH1]|uniref:AI-2E family transporter n=1 Tax=Gleimia sp. 6138-11-ORH1 TaxID=2973937 RepID=UPI002169715C|nr:AI-2E family transporter [Gleimia sp. 6138-11-ORH1]MCS4484082.1 AI-2E family transporter [Gleimia sp. 6138-11-ORH1]